MNSFLMELRSEEIPHRDQISGRNFLENYFYEKLRAFELEYSHIDTFSTPRRLVILIKGIRNETKMFREEKRGPREGSPDMALSGFLKGNNLKKSDLTIRDIKGIKYYFSIKEIAGRKSSEILVEISELFFKNLRWKKSMRWGSNRFKWIRPLKSILALQYSTGKATEVINFQIGGIVSCNKTVGHRFMSSGAFSVTNFKDYVEDLRKNFVELDHKVRARRISSQIELLTKYEGLKVIPDSNLIEEVSGLVEWPMALMGEIEDSFLDLPSEILQTVMKTHQKYFSVEDQNTNKIVKYITVANIVAKDGGKKIIEGNNRVLNSRLADAKFFWEMDKERIEKNGFESFAEGLNSVTFFRGLGTQADRVHRIKLIGKLINKKLYKLPEREIELAAKVCKADLVSSTVKEFPELQGLLGRYFSEISGLPNSVGWACKEHYGPLGPDDQVTLRPLSVIISLADKIDLLASFWSINEKPTSSKDPFGLRRAAIGIIRLSLENEINITFEELFKLSEQKFDLVDAINFLTERLRVYLKDKGVKGSTLDACLRIMSELGISTFVRHVNALNGFLNTTDGKKLLQLSKRALNILLAEEKKDGVEYSLPPEKLESLTLEELDLIKALESSDKKISDFILNENYSDALMLLTSLHPKVENFFETTQINSENSILRRNRLCTLGLIRSMLNRFADFRVLE